MSTFTQQSKLIKNFCHNHLIEKHIGKKSPLLGTCTYMCSIKTKRIVRSIMLMISDDLI